MDLYSAAQERILIVAHRGADGETLDINHYSCDDEEWSAFVLKYLPTDHITSKIKR